jgi:hypothetical protein
MPGQPVDGQARFSGFGVTERYIARSLIRAGNTIRAHS